MSEPEKESIQPPLFREADLLDGRGGQEATADRREESRHRARVLNSVRDFMATRKRKRKGQSYET